MQANHTIKTLTKDNLDVISHTYNLHAETHHFYKTLYSSGPNNNIAQQEMSNTYAMQLLFEQAQNSSNSAIILGSSQINGKQQITRN